jgi:DNA-binding response OmpR family regulator
MAKIDYKLLVAQTRQLTLLYVEDDDTLREVTADLFRKFFALVDVAANGQEGLDQYKRYHKNTHDYYDVVITDLMMPMMDGIEMASEIRHILWNQIIVMISAHSEREHFIKLLEMGVDGFILKPMDHEKLLGALYKAGKKAQDRRMGMAYCAGNEALIAELERVNAGIKALPQNENTAKVQVQMPHIETRALPSDEQQLLRQSFTRKTSAVDYVNDIGGKPQVNPI